MRSSSKSRNRNKNGSRRGHHSGNIINRVFESAGPEGKVRGTPQQIIDKYISLAHDSQLSGDRVAAENFQQHAEHYSRILAEAQKEIAERVSEQNSFASGSSNKSFGNGNNPELAEERSPIENTKSSKSDKAFPNDSASVSSTISNCDTNKSDMENGLDNKAKSKLKQNETNLKSGKETDKPIA